MSLYARIAALIVIVLAIAGAWWKFDRLLAKADKAGYERRAQEDKDAADAQTARNQDLQRAAELKYTVAAQTRDRFFVTTVKEIAHDAAPLAACPIPESVRLRINAATECAGSDSPSTSCAPVHVPGS